MRTPNLRTWLVVAVFLACVLREERASAYSCFDNWCDRYDLGWCRVATTFDSHGMNTAAVFEDMNIAAAWWSEVQSSLRFTTAQAIDYSGFSTHDPGEIEARRNGENPLDDTAFATTWWQMGWHPSCDFFGVNIDGWKIAVSSNNPYTAFALNKSEMPGRVSLFKVMAHEFGHVMGLGHSSDYLSLMYPWEWNGCRLSMDDSDGVVIGLHENRDYKPLKTATMTFISDSALSSFSNIQTISGQNALWGPAIAADHPSFDFILAWVDQDYKIRVGLAGTNGQGTLDVNWVRTTNDYSRAPVAVAVNPQGRIGVAFSGTDSDRTVNFMVSADAGTTWAKTTLWGQHALGGATLTFNEYYGRWIMSWAADRADELGHNMAIVTSDDSTGASWGQTIWFYDDSLSTPFQRPSLVCGNPGQGNHRDKCFMLFKTYATYDKKLETVGFSINPYDYGLDALGAPETIDVTLPTSYMNTNIAYVKPGANRSAKYVALFTDWNLSPAYLNVSIKQESDLNGGNLRFPWPGAAPNTKVTTRSGFAGAFSTRRNVLRILWKEQ